MRFLAIFLSFVPWIDLKMHTLVLLNDLDTWAVMSLMLDHSEITKMPFWDDPKSQKCFIFTIFWSWLCWIDLILHILILLNELDTLAVKSPLLDHSKIKKCLLGWSKELKILRIDQFTKLSSQRPVFRSFSKSPNGSICKVNSLKSIFQHFYLFLPINGWSRVSEASLQYEGLQKNIRQAGFPS